MQSEIILFVLAILLILLFMPIFVQLRVYFNAVKNLGVVAVSVFGIKLICVQIEFNKARQAAITQEITEIVSAANAL